MSYSISPVLSSSSGAVRPGLEPARGVDDALRFALDFFRGGMAELDCLAPITIYDIHQNKKLC